MPEVHRYLNTLLEADSEVILMNGDVPLATLTSLRDSQLSKRDRVHDLYPTLWVSDDFDDLLPGEYWLKEQS